MLFPFWYPCYHLFLVFQHFNWCGCFVFVLGTWNRVPPKNGPPAKLFSGKAQKSIRGRPTKSTGPIEQMSAEQPSKVRLPTNLTVEQPSESGPLSNSTRRSTNQSIEQRSKTIAKKNRCNTAKPHRHDGTSPAMLGLWKRYRGVSIKHDDIYVSLLTCGTK